MSRKMPYLPDREWWVPALHGVAALLFGVLALVWPEITLLALTVLFGAYVLLDGVVGVGGALVARGRPAGDRVWIGLRGLAGIVVGVVTLLWPAITALALLYLIAAWALVVGVLEIVAAVRRRRELRHEWLLGLSGLLAVVFAVLLVLWPAAGALALVTLIGVYAIIFGVVALALAVQLRRLPRGTSGVDRSARRSSATA
jgi:uncharacterized membrane protein HdeD (DUF308 family)